MSTALSEPISESTPITEPEVSLSESALETTPVPEVEPEAEAEAWPEPGPEWKAAFVEWGVAWPLHVYIFAAAYILIALFGIFLIISIVMNRSRGGVNKTTVMLNSMISFFALSRATGLFVDPYSGKTCTVPFMASHMVWSVGIPGLTASFSIVLLILLDTTKMEIAPPRFQKLSVIAAITIVHMVIVVATDILVYFYGATLELLLVFCQMLFVLYGLLVSVGFTYVGIKIRQNTSASNETKDPTSKRLLRLTKTIFISAIVAMAMAVTNLYAAVDIFGVFSPVMIVDSWDWWILQTFLRIEEVAASILVLSVFIKVSPTETVKGFIAEMCFNTKRSSSVEPLTNEESCSPTMISKSHIAWSEKM